MYERALGSRSRWAPYLSFLPNDLSHMIVYWEVRGCVGQEEGKPDVFMRDAPACSILSIPPEQSTVLAHASVGAGGLGCSTAPPTCHPCLLTSATLSVYWVVRGSLCWEILLCEIILCVRVCRHRECIQPCMYVCVLGGGREGAYWGWTVDKQYTERLHSNAN
jgi:hypothetical protein